MRITLVGAGALGSHVLLLARNLEAEWTVVDFFTAMTWLWITFPLASATW